MGPSQDNSFGNFNPGGANPGSFGGGVQMGQPVQPVAGGDIMIGGGEPKDSQKKKIILIALVTVAIVVGIGALIGMAFGQGGGGASGTMEGRYNQYVNYVLFGEVKDAAVSLDDIWDTTVPFYDGLEGDELSQYLETEEGLYNGLTELYYANGGELDLLPIQAYYHDLAQIKPLSFGDVLAEFVQNGKKSTNEYIESYYWTDELGGFAVSYVGSLEQLANVYLDIIVESGQAGCIVGGNMVNDCYNRSLTEENQAKLVNADYTAREERGRITNLAQDALIDLHKELYSVNSEETVEVDG